MRGRLRDQAAAYRPVRLGWARIVRPIGADVEDHPGRAGIPEMAQLCDREAFSREDRGVSIVIQRSALRSIESLWLEETSGSRDELTFAGAEATECPSSDWV